ncbi:MAG TPA: hypothetical protein DCE44_02485 [Verrucomicrobiales bacterium]|nr:hypothetical protein [Verrucomicrobiales bacterium]
MLGSARPRAYSGIPPQSLPTRNGLQPENPSLPALPLCGIWLFHPSASGSVTDQGAFQTVFGWTGRGVQPEGWNRLIERT